MKVTIKTQQISILGYLGLSLIWIASVLGISGLPLLTLGIGLLTADSIQIEIKLKENDSE